MNYFNELQERIREIRLSERFFYQKIKDIYTTSIDYDPKDEKTTKFFKIVQNKLLWAISRQTAAELVYRRVDAALPLLGMQSYDKKSDVKMKKSDISIAKNYLNEDEIKLLGLLVEQYLAFAETMAQQHKLMYMTDWINKLVSFKSVYMGIFYDFFIAQIQLLLMSTAQQKSFLCENGPPRSSSEHRGLFCGKSARYSFLIAVST